MPKSSFISLDMKGWRELEQALYDLGNDRMIRNTMKRAMLEAAEPMARAARTNLMSVTKRGDGSLEESIDVGVRLNRRQASERRGSKAHLIAKGTLVEVFVGAGKGGAQAHLIEFGTGVRRTKGGANRGQIQARPFMRPAWEAHKHQVLTDFGVQLGKEIEASARRIAKKRARKK
jgi:HK97 gp10 family phage protein